MRVIELIRQVKKEEGLRLSPYFDHLGVPSIGYGTTYWDGHPVTMSFGKITKKKALDMLYAKLMHAILEAYRSVTDFDGLDDTRQMCLVEMAYQMGGAGLRRWKKSLIYINEREWQNAYDEMLDSSLYRDPKTQRRAIKYATMILTGD